MKTLQIAGMHCQSCVAKVETALRGVEGVKDATVTLIPPQAQVAGESVESQQLIEAVRAAGDYSIEIDQEGRQEENQPQQRNRSNPLSTYYPLILVLTFVLVGCVILQSRGTAWDWSLFMSDFMGGFFVVFGFFKLLDIRGFANAYSGYDLIAKHLPWYGLVYPFIEVSLGAAYLLRFAPYWTNVFTLVVMLIGTLGVVQALIDKKKIRCACLGTVFNLPMSTVTIIEDAGMATMALVMLSL